MRLKSRAAGAIRFALGRSTYELAPGGVIEVDDELGRIALTRGMGLVACEEAPDTEPASTAPAPATPAPAVEDNDELGPDIAAAVEALAAEGVTLPPKKRRR